MLQKIFLLLLILIPTLTAQETAVLKWPRVYEVPGAKLTVHQPQIDEWKNYKTLFAKSAIMVDLNGLGKPTFGALYFNVETRLNVEKRLSALENLKITKIFFPDTDADIVKKCTDATKKALSNRKSIVVSMDRIVELVEESKDLQKNVKVSYEAPTIFYSEKDAILINFLGKPKFEKLGKSGLEHCINTNWDLLYDPEVKEYYLFHGASWLKTKALKNSSFWNPIDQLPKKFRNIPDESDWAAIINKATTVAKNIPQVFISEKPAELITTDGKIKLTEIKGTDLSFAENSDADLFFSSKTKQFYFLVTGRWFQAEKLDGKWESTLEKLPKDFVNIPEGHPKENVKAAIAGTDDANAAVIMASMPKKAKVERSTTLEVTYDGEPELTKIKGSDIEFALNTSYDVFKVDGKYYCCYKAVWFVADSPKGKWAVATTAPESIYNIPSDSPKHHVTYVYIESYTDDVVYIYCTSGYYGCYVSNGVIVYGCGYWLWQYPPRWYHYHCYPWYYSYGCGIRIDYYRGDYYRGAHYYGPYGGIGGWAKYNPDTGAYRRGGFAYGPNGSVQWQRAYNPDTGWRVAGHKVTTPYESWGKGVVSNGKEWAKVGYKNDYDRGKALGFKTSEGAKGIIGKGNDGKSSGVIRDTNEDLYVGKDGNVYRKSDNGWEKRQGDGNWSPIEKKQTRPSTTDKKLTDAQQKQLKQEQLRKIQEQQRLVQDKQKRELLDKQKRDLQNKQLRQRSEQQRKMQEHLRRQSQMRQRSNIRTVRPRTRSFRRR